MLTTKITNAKDLKVGDIITSRHMYYPENRNESTYIYTSVVEITEVRKYDYSYVEEKGKRDAIYGTWMPVKANGCLVTLREKLEKGSAVIERDEEWDEAVHVIEEDPYDNIEGWKRNQWLIDSVDNHIEALRLNPQFPSLRIVIN